MKELGAWLRETREDKQISLAELEEKTKIKAKYLSDIEEGDSENLPAEVYLRGFLRSYSKCVGLDQEQVLAQYDYLRNPPKPEKKALRKKKAERLRKQRFTAGIFLITAIIVFLFYYFYVQ